MSRSKITETRSIFMPIVTLLAVLLATPAVVAQDDEIDDIGPAVDTSTIELQVPETDTAVEAADTSAADDSITRRTTGNRVMDSIELSRTEITGNSELPKVLYIVPWKKADPGDLMGKPINSLLDEILAPLDREEFNRHIDYYDDLYGDKQE